MIKFLVEKYYGDDGVVELFENYKEALDYVHNYDYYSSKDQRDNYTYRVINLKKNYGRVFKDKEEFYEFEENVEFINRETNIVYDNNNNLRKLRRC